MTKQKMKFWAGLMALFLSGMLVGGLITVHLMRGFIANLVHGGPASINEWVVDRISGHLDLTPDQEERINAIVQDTQEKLDRETDAFHPHIHAIIQTEIESVRGELTPDQVKKFDRIMTRIQKHHKMIEPYPTHSDHHGHEEE